MTVTTLRLALNIVLLQLVKKAKLQSQRRRKFQQWDSEHSQGCTNILWVILSHQIKDILLSYPPLY